ncbi:MAG TPA: B12-binding domain-containing protein [Pyrinomonadaceae bacterium]|nr:B12-binding domain-containing protein [Pyrinomonadaceae bacterium]
MSKAAPKFLTTRQLARLWLVSEATIKRWADAGHLHFNRTIGGHRRFSFEEVTRFQAERGLGRAAFAAARRRASLDVPDDAAADFDMLLAAERFFEAIAAGREGMATAILLEPYMRGVELSKLFDETVAVAMWRVGKLWHGGEMSVADEHLATRTAVRAVESLSISVRHGHTGAERQAICCATEEEYHEIPILCVQVLLESEGWSVKNFGANTPFFALTDAVEKYSPALVCVSSTTHSALERNARDYAEFRRAVKARRARIVLGGEGFRNPATRQRFPADLHAESFRDLVEFLRD